MLRKDVDCVDLVLGGKSSNNLKRFGFPTKSYLRRQVLAEKAMDLRNMHGIK